MPKLRNMLGETGTIEIPVSNDEPLIVSYRRGVMTPRRQIKILSMQRDLGDLKPGDMPPPVVLEEMVNLLAELIVSWNLTDDGGAALPTDAESLLDVDLSILTGIMDEIGRQGRPDPLSRSDSNNGSTPRADLEPLPITTGS